MGFVSGERLIFKNSLRSTRCNSFSSLYITVPILCRSEGGKKYAGLLLTVSVKVALLLPADIVTTSPLV